MNSLHWVTSVFIAVCYSDVIRRVPAFVNVVSPPSLPEEKDIHSHPTVEVSMSSTLLLRAGDIERLIERLALQVIEHHGDCSSLVLVGIQRRGVDLARRLAAHVNERLECAVPLGTLDINLYRDDWTSLLGKPQIGQSSIPVRLDNKVVLLVDDVLFTGRTVRSALEALLDYGRPQKVELLVLIDRGHRELPVHADYVGQTLETARAEHVNVLLEERDGLDEVRLQTK